MTHTTPRVILFRGMPGVGKTFISDKIAGKLGIAIIRKDDIYDNIHLYIDTHQLRNKICYALIYQLIDTNFKAGVDLIVDCPFRDHNDLDQLSDFIKDRQGILKPILCVCSDEALWAKRFNVRAENPQPNNLITDFEVLKTHYPSLHPDRYRDELVLDTQLAADELAAQVQQYL